MARGKVSRSFVLTLFTGVTVLVAMYVATRYSTWEPGERLTLGLAFLTVAAVVYFADWYVHGRARQ